MCPNHIHKHNTCVCMYMLTLMSSKISATEVHLSVCVGMIHLASCRLLKAMRTNTAPFSCAMAVCILAMSSGKKVSWVAFFSTPDCVCVCELLPPSFSFSSSQSSPLDTSSTTTLRLSFKNPGIRKSSSDRYATKAPGSGSTREGTQFFFRRGYHLPNSHHDKSAARSGGGGTSVLGVFSASTPASAAIFASMAVQ